MSKGNPDYKNVVGSFFSKKEEKKVDKVEEVSYTGQEQQDSKQDLPFEPDYKAYCIIRKGKKYLVASVEIDSNTAVTAGSAFIAGEYDSEVRALKEMNILLAERAKKYRKEDK